MILTKFIVQKKLKLLRYAYEICSFIGICRDFPGTKQYWENRYRSGGNSGSGSYDILAEFKAEILNDFVVKNDINKVIEFGCGDGNQVSYFEFKNYVGLDISTSAIDRCSKNFKTDNSKLFFVHDSSTIEKFRNYNAELTISLDVIFHLIEDETFDEYMHDLFNYSTRFVIIYSSDFDEKQFRHEKPRKFTEWVAKNKKDWMLTSVLENRYPYDILIRQKTSQSNFYFYSRIH